ncbi:MAG: cytochrome b, partial [Moraxellaceae bacterium]|nr:cytochrome b [Moraxellaceae bacterium]
PLKTPAHIAPVWYYTPFYAMLRATPSLFGSAFPGVVVMGGAIAIMFVLPWLDRSPVKSIRYKGWMSKVWLGIFVVSFVILGYLGVVPSTGTTFGISNTPLAQILTVLYFLYFLLMPVYTSIEKCKPVPERLTGGSH